MAPHSILSFRERTREARNWLVVDFGFLGDSVQLVPTLWELKRHLPGAQLHVLTTRVGGEVLRMAPCVDRVWDLELMPDRRTWREQFRVLRDLRRQAFDAAITFSGSDRTLFWTWFSAARERAAHTWGKPHLWAGWMIPDIVPQQDPDLPIARQRLRVLASLGFSAGPLRYDLDPGEASRQHASTLVPEGAAHLSINAAKPLKEWPLEHSIQLAQQLLKHWPRLHLVASASSRERERERLQRLERAVHNPRLRCLPADLGIADLAAVLRRCRIHIGPDSGVMNLATAMGVPTISFFRDQPGYKSWLPCGDQDHAFVGNCHCVDHRDAPCLASARAECLAAITPDMAFRVIQSRLPPP
ncbi:MAG: glycosyltransferase family 9 protein [Verrucomicrobia bacterium]|jgi:heptosyltransferase-1|nr:glycosyltransferase family 9 protein [Verrucomicrobiota bacterium]